MFETRVIWDGKEQRVQIWRINPEKLDFFSNMNSFAWYRIFPDYNSFLFRQFQELRKNNFELENYVFVGKCLQVYLSGHVRSTHFILFGSVSFRQ